MKENDQKAFRGWIYAEQGDFHRNLDPNWSFTPTYLRKMAYIKALIRALPKEMRILDAGCGEGVLVEQFASEGYDVKGIDLNYESEHVQRGSVLGMPFSDNRFDVVLLLDVFEHLAYADQPKALVEISRVLKEDGLFIISIPNLAHWNSRFRMAALGRLDRTDIETNHIGERPYWENRRLLTEAGFRIEKVKGVTLTVPFVYRKVICRRPAWFRWLHDLFQVAAVPSLSLIDIFICKNALSEGHPSDASRH